MSLIIHHSITDISEIEDGEANVTWGLAEEIAAVFDMEFEKFINYGIEE